MLGEISRGKLQQTAFRELGTNATIKECNPEESYKYLRMDKRVGIQHAAMKGKIRKEYFRRINNVVNPELNPKIRIGANNNLTLTVV